MKTMKKISSSKHSKSFSSSSMLRGKALVVAEHDNGKLAPSTLNSISAASSLGPVDVLVVGAGQSCQAVAEAASWVKGVQSVFVADDPAFAHPTAESLCAAVLSHHKSGNYTHVLTPSSAYGKNFLPRLGALLDLQPISDVQKVIDESTFSRPIYAGSAIETVKSSDPVKLITVRTTSFEAAPKNTTQSPIQATKDKASLEGAPQKAQWKNSHVQASDRPDLSTADIIVTGGRGLKAPENFKLVYDLAAPLKAGVGATRAVVDAGFVPNDMQIGQTGKIVAPTLYIAVGVSGAIQHIAGMKGSKVIVAINNDADAPIFTVSDFGLVADLFQVVPELTEKIKKLKE